MRNNNQIVWAGEEIRQALNCQCPNISATGVCINSKAVKSGEIFIGLQGENFNGSNFAEEALNSGAALAIVDSTYKGKEDERIIKVENTKTALWKLAQFARNRSSAIFIAVTGSVGKTSTKEMLKLAFSRFGNSYASFGNFNTEYGLPVTLCNMPINTQFAIYELGMRAAGEIALLSNLLKPNYAIITKIASVHKEFFNSIEDIARAKAEIVEGMSADSDIILNHDDETFTVMKEIAEKKGINITTFGKEKGADVLLHKTKIKDDSTIVQTKGNINLEYELNLIGEHFVLNSLAALALVSQTGLDAKTAMSGLKAFSPLAGRGQIIELPEKQLTIIDETYNSNPEALKMALQRLNILGKKKRKVALLGDMLELGENAEEIHRNMLNDIIASDINLVFTTGELMQNLYNATPTLKKGKHYENSADMANEVTNFIKEYDCILIKGSNSIKMKTVLDKLLA